MKTVHLLMLVSQVQPLLVPCLGLKKRLRFQTYCPILALSIEILNMCSSYLIISHLEFYSREMPTKFAKI